MISSTAGADFLSYVMIEMIVVLAWIGARCWMTHHLGDTHYMG
jgi:hypothetical protein